MENYISLNKYVHPLPSVKSLSRVYSNLCYQIHSILATSYPVDVSPFST